MAFDEGTLARVLVVDDDLATRRGLSELLQLAGYACTAAGSFEEALDALRSAPPDILITDIRLGSKNGLQLVIKQAQAIPSIVITGFDDSTLEADALREGATYVRKPVAPTELLEQVAMAVSRRRGSSHVERAPLSPTQPLATKP